MSTQTSLTRDEVMAAIKASAAESLAPALETALAPLSKAQGDFFARMEAKDGEPNELEAADRALGKYRFGRKARALALAALENGTQDPGAAIHACRKHWRKTAADPTIKWLEAVQKGLTFGTAVSAGDMVFPEYDPEWIELLRNNAVVRGIARVIPMPRGTSTRRKQTGAATASYQTETGPITASAQTVTRVNLSYKKLTAMTVVSNDLIRFSGGEADRFVQEDLLRVSALREDRAFLVGNPPTDANSPKGIRYWTIAAQVTAKTGITLANFQADLTDSIADVQDANVIADPNNSYWIMSPRTFWSILALATTTGDMLFRAELADVKPRLFGFPVLLTTQLGVGNSWIGAGAGMIIFVHAPSLEIHDSMSRTVEAWRGGAYYDGTVVQSGISNDETVITSIAEHDFLQVYDVAASIKTTYAT
jgi:HK97 family phage major capsid protein